MATPERTSSSSPKSSTKASSPQPPLQAHSPRFNVFHRHFHSKAHVDSSSSEIQPDTAVVSAPARTEAIRDAKRFLLAAVRDDWSFPPPHPLQPAEDEPREPVEYRAREGGLSDIEADSDEPGGESMLSTPDGRDPYRFESPDAIAVSVQERRRKRKKLLHEEMKWNVGLRVWVQQRDAWTGAVRERPRQSGTSDGEPSASSIIPTNATTLKPSDSTETSAQWPLSSHSPGQGSSPSRASSSAASDSPASADPTHVLIPVYPPLLPSTNPVRASIKPSVYTMVYSKVVVQGLTPTVPIPLPHMVAALVQGWKAEDNWPPKGGTPTTSIINEGSGPRKHAQSHMLRFKKAHDEVNGQEKWRMRRQVGGAMRKALGLSKDGEGSDQPEGLGIEFEDDHKDEDVQMEGDEKSGNMSESFRVM